MAKKGKKKKLKSPHLSSEKLRNVTLNGHAPVQFSEQEDSPLFFSVLFSPLVIGSLTGSGLSEPKLMLFFLVMLPCVLGYHLAGKLKQDKERRLRQQPPNHPLLAPLLFLAIAGSLLSFFSTSASAHATAILAISCICIVLIRLSSMTSVAALLVRSLLLISFSSVAAILGVYSQTNEIRLSTFVLGFSSGSILAAAGVAKMASLFDSLGWKRKTTTQRPRPGLPAQLYALLLMAIPSLCITLAFLGIFPFPILLALLPQLLSPKLATSFLEKIDSDQVVYEKTVIMGGGTSICMLIAGLLSRG